MKQPAVFQHMDLLIDSQWKRGTFTIWLRPDQFKEYNKYLAHCQQTRFNLDKVKPCNYRGYPLRSVAKIHGAAA